nr:unnamed protein product [Digitaria exilis]
MVHHRSFLILLTAIVSSFPIAEVAVAQYYTAYEPYCSTTGNYTTGSPYQVNLVKLMSDLPSGAMANSGSYYGTAGDAPDAVYGLAMCYADLNWTACGNCLRAAAAGVQQACPFSREMKSFYQDTCILRYSSEPFASVADADIAFYVWDDGSYVADPAAFNATRRALMARLAGEASGSPLRLANGSQAYTDSRGAAQVLYGLAQCTRDLNASECTRCLTFFLDDISVSLPNSTYGSAMGYRCYMVCSVGEQLSITVPPPSSAAAAASRAPSGRRTALVAGVSLGCAAFFMFVGISIWVLLCRNRRRVRKDEFDAFDDNEPMEDDFEKGTGPRRFRYRVLAVATRFVSEDEKLGEGGFGSVYHGYLKDMNLHVAIKRVSKGSRQGRKEYVSEVRIISRLRHRNLVQLIGWCHGGGELLLDWEPCVVHRDIKPSNVMLDASFSAKLGDFGLARLVDHNRESHTTALAGTMGYMDPECMLTGNTSAMSDVYSFGVVSLEIACGRRPIVLLQQTEEVTESERETMHLVQWVWDLYGHGRIVEAADPRLNCDFDEKEMERVMVTALCMRPSIRQAVNVLRREAPLPTLPAVMPQQRRWIYYRHEAFQSRVD